MTSPLEAPVPPIANPRRHACLVCGKDDAEPFLDLGAVPLANALLSSPPADPAAEPRFRLAVSYCHDCHAVQLEDLVPPQELFSEYFYFSSFSDAFLAHAKDYAASLTSRFDLDAGSFVVEIASNDGYLLKNFKDAGIPILGVEPARNIAEVAEDAGIPTLNRFFDSDSSALIRAEHGAADVIIGNNVLAHVPTLVPFLTAAHDLLKPEGVAVFEFPWLQQLVEKLEFDTIYHEHVYYFSLAAVKNAAALAGLEVFDVLEQKVHGGSLRVFLQRPGARPTANRVAALLQRETEAGLTSPEPFRRMGQRVEQLKRELCDLLTGLKEDGKRIAAYGASAKGSTLLNYCGIGKDTIDYIVDRSTHKQGHFAPGVHLEILPVERLAEDKPDYTVLLAWNFADEIRSQQQDYEKAGGRFVHPVPTPRVLD